mgnify:CR=1 FL=1
MRRFLHFIFLVIPFIYVSAQDTDELIRLEKQLEITVSDTGKVRILNELALLVSNKDTTRAFNLLNSAIEISDKAGNYKDLGMSCQNMGHIYYAHFQYAKSIELTVKAQEAYKRAGENVLLGQAVVDEGNAHLYLSDFSTALERYKTAEELFKGENNIPGICRALNNIGIIQKYFGEYQKALHSYDLVLEYYQQLNDTASMVDTYINMGNVHVLLGDYNKALEFLNKALINAQHIGYMKQEGIALMNSGVIHNKTGDYKKAQKYYERSLEIGRKMENKVEIAKNLTNIGTNYISLGEYDLAEKYIQEGLAIKLELGNRESISNSYNYLSEIKFHQKEYQESLDYDLLAIQIKYEINDPEGLAACYNNMSRTNLALNNYQGAISFADSALSYSLDIGALEHIANSYNYKKQGLASLGQYYQAYILSDLYKKFSDSLMNVGKAKAVNEIEVKYRSQVLEEENERLRVQTNLKSILIKRHRKIIVFGTIAIMLFALSIILLITIQRKQKTYALSLQHKNLIITRQNIKLDTLNRTKDKILSVITHDLRGTIGNQLTALSVLAREEFRSEEERKLVFSRLANSATMSLEILENLSLWTKLQEETLHYEPEQGYLDRTLKDVIANFDEPLRNKEIAVLFENHGEYACFFDQKMISSTLKNILSNAIKFSDRGSQIKCKITSEGNMVTLSIADNGIGISEGELDQIRKGVISKMHRGTENEKGSGLGLSIVRNLLGFHGSKLEISSTPEEGSIFSFSLPVNRPS